jgi:hypothetical protein
MRIFSDNNYAYSVDMMFLHTKKMKQTVVNITPELRSLLDVKLWDLSDGTRISPNQVIMYPIKYPAHWKLIKNADLSYPIILYGNRVVDGMHRLSKAIVENQTTIPAYCLDTATFKKFIIGKNTDSVQDLQQNIIKYLYQLRF